MLLISLPHTANFNIHIDREEHKERLQAEILSIRSTVGVAITDPVYVVKGDVKHNFNEFFSRRMLQAIPITDTPDRMTLRMESDGWQIQVADGVPVPFTHIDASYAVQKDEQTITAASDRIAELLIQGFGDEDVVIFGDQLERRMIDPQTGVVI